MCVRLVLLEEEEEEELVMVMVVMVMLELSVDVRVRERLPSLVKEAVRRCRANPWKPSADTDSIESRIR